MCKEEMEGSSNDWIAIQWKGVKGINETIVKREDDLVIEVAIKVRKHVVSSTQIITILEVCDSRSDE
ncbi:hypothetical protein DPMN_016777 [Dreissena polymorpha]|uniref:Uncharacterized protein n=1 Tax=Dreissena polymorpha TaxID=45954 RepID=A0A9D4NFF3_DREPO|nr:hypothetical protein DPMN_016777 [Dreissena polymorpha]